MASDDYYTLLGVSKNASQDDIKRAYKKLAKEYHPDRNPSPEAAKKFQNISNAYDVLSNPEKRKMYDMTGSENASGGGSGFQDFSGFGGGFGNFGGFNSGGFGGGFADIFDTFFGGGGSRRANTERGSTLQIDISISLEEAFFGTQKKVTISTKVKCENCGGTGSKTRAKPEICKTCNGTGQFRTRNGFLEIMQTCHSCGGEGKKVSNPCGVCSGTGLANGDKSVSIDIPAGVQHKSHWSISGAGEAGTVYDGDLQVIILIKEHPIFKRDGNDLLCEVPIPMVTACIGGNINIPTLEGMMTLNVPSGTQNGAKLKIAGKGMKTSSSYRGDMYVIAKVEIPVNINSKQIDLLTQFENEMKNNSCNPQSSGFIDKMQKFFDNLKKR